MSNVIERIKELQEKRAAAEQAIADEGKDLFAQASAEVFAANPRLISFGWTQYTPYFNDGDECIFRCNTDYIRLNVDESEEEEEVVEPVVEGEEPKEVEDDDEEDDEEDEDEYDDDDDDEDEFDGYGLDEIPEDKLTPKQKAGKAVLDLLSLFADEDYKLLFGDHVKVTVSSTGVHTTTEYSHD
jgi:hypothetical protein